MNYETKPEVKHVMQALHAATLKSLWPYIAEQQSPQWTEVGSCEFKQACPWAQRPGAWIRWQQSYALMLGAIFDNYIKEYDCFLIFISGED